PTSFAGRTPVPGPLLQRGPGGVAGRAQSLQQSTFLYNFITSCSGILHQVQHLRKTCQKLALFVF
ncbi:MAG: hypothetical protein Q4C22_07995, partial [Bacillota bacterium]|nr:hypothetical protein [Bacillota bacterium]